MQPTRTTMLLYIAVAAALAMVARGAFTRGQTVVASMPLTGALAKAAGAREVRILTPPEAKDPPAYELLRSDLAQLNGATAVVLAGYEKMAPKLVGAAKGRGLTIVQVDTTISPDSFIAQARKIGGVFHTSKDEETWEKGFLQRVAALKSGLAPYSGRKAVVHAQTESFAAWAGLTVVQVISPGEVSPKTVAEAAAKKPAIVLDALPAPTAKAIAENAGCPYALLIIYPGAEKTATLEDILEYDAARIEKAFNPR